MVNTGKRLVARAYICHRPYRCGITWSDKPERLLIVKTSETRVYSNIVFVTKYAERKIVKYFIFKNSSERYRTDLFFFSILVFFLSPETRNKTRYRSSFVLSAARLLYLLQYHALCVWTTIRYLAVFRREPTEHRKRHSRGRELFCHRCEAATHNIITSVAEQLYTLAAHTTFEIHYTNAYKCFFFYFFFFFFFFFSPLAQGPLHGICFFSFPLHPNDAWAAKCSILVPGYLTSN